MEYTFKNAKYSLISQFVSLVLTFVSKTVFLRVLVKRAKYNYFRREGGIAKGEFGYGAFGVVDVMRSMLVKEIGTEIHPHCIKGFTDAAFIVLSGIITSRKCEDRFDGLVKEILSYRKDILFGGHQVFKDKVKVIILTISKKLYRSFIRFIHI